MNNKSTRKTILLNIVAWLLPVTVFALGMRSFLASFHALSLIALVHVPLVYFNSLVLLPHYFMQKKYVLYFMLLSAVVVIYGFFREYMIYGVIDQYVPEDFITVKDPNAVFDPVDNYVECLIILFLTTAIKLAKDWFVQQRNLAALQQQHLRAELAMLHQQLNPHFLFNTLNTLYALTLEQSANAPQVVLKLSEIMRYVVYESNSDLVPLEREISYLQNFVELQRMRIRDKANIDMQVEGEATGLLIAPMILITFVENAFKHSINSTDQAFIQIHLRIQAQMLYFKVLNNYEQETIQSVSHQGIGIAHTRKRLNLLYGSNHVLNISDDCNQFVVNLVLTLHES